MLDWWPGLYKLQYWITHMYNMYITYLYLFTCHFISQIPEEHLMAKYSWFKFCVLRQNDSDRHQRRPRISHTPKHMESPLHSLLFVFSWPYSACMGLHLCTGILLRWQDVRFSYTETQMVGVQLHSCMWDTGWLNWSREALPWLTGL